MPVNTAHNHPTLLSVKSVSSSCKEKIKPEIYVGALLVCRYRMLNVVSLAVTARSAFALSGSTYNYSSIHLDVDWVQTLADPGTCHPFSSYTSAGGFHKKLWLIENEVFCLSSAGMMILKCLQMKPLTQLRRHLQCELAAEQPGL